MDYLLNYEINRSKRGFIYKVLNLIINGLPSKLNNEILSEAGLYKLGFKPYYKWTTF